jgi:hypothetical protein
MGISTSGKALFEHLGIPFPDGSKDELEKMRGKSILIWGGVSNVQVKSDDISLIGIAVRRVLLDHMRFSSLKLSD